MPSPNTPRDGPHNSNLDDILRDVLKKTLQSDIGPDAFFRQLGMNAEEITLYYLYLRFHTLGTAPEDDAERASLGTTIQSMAVGMDTARRTFIENLAKAALGIHHANVEENLDHLRQEFSTAMAKLRGEELKPPPPSPEPLPEAAAEAPGFSRYLKDILADPDAPEAKNLLAKFRSPNGRLWVDRKRADGSVVRIWFSLSLTPEEKSKPDAEFIAIIKGKLAPGGLRFRVDDFSAGHSWKEKWTAKKTGIGALVAGIAAVPDVERPAACVRIAEALFGAEETDKPDRDAFAALLQQYLARPDGKTDIWTHVRNAYWHTYGWKNETDAKNDLNGLGVPPDSLKPPSYASAKIRVWQKIGEEPRGAEIEGKSAPLFHNGTKYAADTIAKTFIANGQQKGIWYRIGPHWIREEHLRISLRQDPPLPAGEALSEGAFELLAWQVQPTPPTEGAAPSATPPPEPKGPATPPEGSGAETEKRTGHPSIREELEKEEGFVVPTDENIQEEWLKAHEGIKIKLKVHATETPAPIPCMVTRKQKARAGYVQLHYLKNGRGLGNMYFAIAELRRLNLPTTPPDTSGTVPPKPAPKESREAAEILRQQEVIAIPDIHGDADALFDSLKEAGYVKGKRTGTWELEPKARTERIILTGDLLDRGPQNLETMDLLLELRKRSANIEIVAGNHDIFIPEALGEELPKLNKPNASVRALIQWIGNDEHPTKNNDGALCLQEICKRYFADDADFSKMIALCKRAHTAAYFALDSGDSTAFCNTLADPLLRKVFQKAQEVFFSEKEPYKAIFDGLNIMTAADDVLFVHAGINDQWVQIMLDAVKDETDPQRRREKAVQAANSHFKKLMRTPSSFTQSSWNEIIWIRNFHGKMTPKTAKGLQQLGFRMVIHGHDRDHHAHEAKDVHGIWIVNGDVSMSAGYSGARKAFIRIGKDGTVAAQNGTKKLPKLAQLPTKKPPSGESYRGLPVW